RAGRPAAYFPTGEDRAGTAVHHYLRGPAEVQHRQPGRHAAVKGPPEKLHRFAVRFPLPLPPPPPFTDFWSGLPAKFKFGPAYAYRTRSFDERRFDYGVNGAPLDLGAPPETVHAPSNLVPGVVDVSETTQHADRWSVRRAYPAA